MSSHLSPIQAATQGKAGASPADARHADQRLGTTSTSGAVGDDKSEHSDKHNSGDDGANENSANNHVQPISVQPNSVSQETIVPTTRAYTPDCDLTTLSLDELCTSEAVYNRELAWLDFNWRVLYQALNPRTPLLERLKFLAITSSNLDEFFRKRVGGLKRQQAAGIANLALRGWPPDFQLALIAKAVHPMIDTQSTCLLDDILPPLAEHGLRIQRYAELGEGEKAYLRDYYTREIYPILMPLAVDAAHPFPFLSNLSLSVGVFLRDPVNDELRFARVKAPSTRPRWIPLEEPLHFVPLEEVIIHNLASLFPGMEIRAAYPFRVTRNADMARNEDEADDLVDLIAEELREQRFAPVVRLEVDEAMPANMVALLRRELMLDETDIYRVRGPLNLTDLFGLADINLPHLKYAPWMPMTPPRLSGLDVRNRPGEIFSIISQGDLMVHHPYISFGASTQQFVEAAARDPQVLAIKQTLYRTSTDSPIIEALIQAAEQGKQVAVLVEVKARFDEARNIEMARKLENAGCHVAYGLVGLKIHSKVSMAIRQEAKGLKAYYHVGTGNYNPRTATLYTDLGILGCRPDVGADLMDLFNFLTGYSRQTDYRTLLIAPVNMRRNFLAMLDNEIEQALAGKPARMIAKMNGLEDPLLVRKLYEASQAGVEIDLIIRGVCRLRPGLRGISDNIRVISVLGRFLEHSRIIYFLNGGEPRYFIGSADWMARNLNDRVEAVIPVEEERLCEQLEFILNSSLNDQRLAWEMLPDGRYRLRHPQPGDRGPAAQGTHETLMDFTRALAGQIQDS